jgi:hypothetical protein
MTACYEVALVAGKAVGGGQVGPTRLEALDALRQEPLVGALQVDWWCAQQGELSRGLVFGRACALFG